MTSIQVKTELPLDELFHAVEQLSLPDLERLMSQVVALQAQRKGPSLAKSETELLLKINQGLSTDVQKRFDELVTKRQAETLSEDEYQELVKLTDDIEKSDAERVRYLAELARLRGVALTTLMDDLGIQPPAYA